MQAVVKTPRIEVNIKGDIPPKLLSVLKEEFGEDIHSIRLVCKDLIDYKGIDYSDGTISAVDKLKKQQMCDLMVLFRNGKASLIELKGESSEERLMQAEKRLNAIEKIILDLWGEREISKKAAFYEKEKYSCVSVERVLTKNYK